MYPASGRARCGWRDGDEGRKRRVKTPRDSTSCGHVKRERLLRIPNALFLKTFHSFLRVGWKSESLASPEGYDNNTLVPYTRVSEYGPREDWFSISSAYYLNNNIYLSFLSSRYFFLLSLKLFNLKLALSQVGWMFSLSVQIPLNKCV